MKISRRKFLVFSGIGLLPGRTLSQPARMNRPRLQPTVSSKSRETWIELNMAHLDWNLEMIKKRVKVPIMAVIKANAYGHGLLEVGQHLDSANIEALMVCKVQEAIALKKSGVACPVYNFGPLFPQACEDLVHYGIGQFLSSYGYEHLAAAAGQQKKRVKVHIQVDTGMNRMGVPYREAPAYLRKIQTYQELQILGISTTLTEDEAFDREQIKRFLDVCTHLNNTGSSSIYRHAASSAGIFSASDFYLDMIRPGIALYGYYPNHRSAMENSLKLKPVLQFKTRIAEVRSLNKGESGSYHRSYKAQNLEKIAVLPVGYSDGIPPASANKGAVLIRGKKCPIIASVTANHMIVRLPSGLVVSPGEETILIGSQGDQAITADDFAAWADSSNYRILIGLNPQITRRVLPD